jgi:hypothetical protein
MVEIWSELIVCRDGEEEVFFVCVLSVRVLQCVCFVLLIIFFF